MIKWYHHIFWPFALIYGGIIWLRNLLFDRNIFKSLEFDRPVIALGNLNLGGSGKTPHTLFFAKTLCDEGYQVAILSRGYGRRKKGFQEVNENSAADDVGDEPKLLYNKGKGAFQVFVDSNRVIAIMRIFREYPGTDVVLLDDALQHRSLKAGLSILLTREKRPFYKDLILPVGTLRDERKSAKRADAMIVTQSKGQPKIEHLKNKYHVPVTASYYKYSEPIHLAGPEMKDLPEQWILLTAIANPEPLLRFYQDRYKTVKHCQYHDHHRFVKKDLDNVQKIFNNLANFRTGIVTTRKDWVKIKPLLDQSLEKLPWFIQDIEVEFSQGGEVIELIKSYVKENRRNDQISEN